MPTMALQPPWAAETTSAIKEPQNILGLIGLHHSIGEFPALGNTEPSCLNLSIVHFGHLEQPALDRSRAGPDLPHEHHRFWQDCNPHFYSSADTTLTIISPAGLLSNQPSQREKETEQQAPHPHKPSLTQNSLTPAGKETQEQSSLHSEGEEEEEEGSRAPRGRGAESGAAVSRAEQHPPWPRAQ